MLDFNVSMAFDGGEVSFVAEVAQVAEEAAEPPTCQPTAREVITAIIMECEDFGWIGAGEYEVAKAMLLEPRVIPDTPIIMANARVYVPSNNERDARREVAAAVVVRLVIDAGHDPETIEAESLKTDEVGALDRLCLALFGYERAGWHRVRYCVERWDGTVAEGDV